MGKTFNPFQKTRFEATVPSCKSDRNSKISDENNNNDAIPYILIEQINKYTFMNTYCANALLAIGEKKSYVQLSKYDLRREEGYCHPNRITGRNSK